MNHRPGRRAAAGLAAVLLGVTVASCGTDDSDTEDDAAAAPSDSTSAEATDPSSVEPTAGDYLPVPGGVELSEPGTEVGLGDAATAAWEPRVGLVGVVEVSVVALERTTIAKSFAGYELDERTRTSTPYFVRTEVTNRGDTDLGGRQIPLYALDDQGRLVEPTAVGEDYERCDGAMLPAIFAPDDEAQSCLVYLVPAGARLTSAVFRPPEGVVPITWTGEVTRFKPSSLGKGKGNGNGNGNGKGNGRGRGKGRS